MGATLAYVEPVKLKKDNHSFIDNLNPLCICSLEAETTF